jgi:hypothetical protein
MDHTHILMIAAAIAIGVLVVLRWIFLPQRKPRGSAPRASDAPGTPNAPGAGGAWDGAARRRRDLAT